MKNNAIEVLAVKNLKKSFILHNQNSIELPVFENISFSLKEGECLVLAGPSGTGKSTLLRSIYGNYLTHLGEINIFHNQSWINLVEAPPHSILKVRRQTLGYVSQFLRVIPRISTLDLVAEPLLEQGETEVNSINRAKDILQKLAIPETLWDLPPATFSGGEQQRVNIAITFVKEFPILLLDEPTNFLDLEGVFWLQGFLAKYPHTALIISHDRDLLNRSVNSILHVNNKSLRLYSGNFDIFDEQRRENLRHQAAAANKHRVPAFTEEKARPSAPSVSRSLLADPASDPRARAPTRGSGLARSFVPWIWLVDLQKAHAGVVLAPRKAA